MSRPTERRDASIGRRRARCGTASCGAAAPARAGVAEPRLNRRAGRVPASNPPHALAFGARWPPVQAGGTEGEVALRPAPLGPGEGDQAFGAVRSDRADADEIVVDGDVPEHRGQRRRGDVDRLLPVLRVVAAPVLTVGARTLD